MATAALGVCVSVDQLELRVSMIEPFLESGSIDSLPSARVVTIGALLTHLLLVLVIVTIQATLKSQVDVLDAGLPNRSIDRLVTLFACCVAVHAGQTISRLIMIKPRQIIPGGFTVTVRTGLARELPGMRIVSLVTSQARGAHP